jgi:hypothetical protein
LRLRLTQQLMARSKMLKTAKTSFFQAEEMTSASLEDMREVDLVSAISTKRRVPVTRDPCGEYHID